MKRSKVPVTAVFDIGKTNKKFLLFDKNYRVVHKKSTETNQAYDDDGDPCEDINQLIEWIVHQFDLVLGNEDYEVKKLNFSTFGATLVHLNKKGKLATPVYNYLKEYPQSLLEKFYSQYGSREKFSVETASPPMGMLNSGLQLYWLKYCKGNLFEKIKHTLHFPQYLAYLFTDEMGAELTSIGCHTGMWDYKKNKYHHWLKEEGMREFLPPVQPVESSYHPSESELNIEVGNGIHDSSAALAPYLVALEDPFLLVSTGTWSISFNPFNTDPLTFEELKRDCLCYMNIYGEQVKASRFFMGEEYKYQTRHLELHFDEENSGSTPKLNLELLQDLITESNPSKQLKLKHAQGFGNQRKSSTWELDCFNSYEEAYHQLMLDLVYLQAECIELVEQEKKLDTLIVTGGFSKNNFFIKLLASVFPEKKVYTASLSNASALGAALVINDLESFGEKEREELLNLTLHKPLPKTGIQEYHRNCFLRKREE